MMRHNTHFIPRPRLHHDLALERLYVEARTWLNGDYRIRLLRNDGADQDAS
jgi:hypothetical protein